MRDLFSEYINTVVKRKIAHFKNWQRIQIDISSKKIYKWPISTLKEVQDFPGGPVVKTPHFPCRGQGFDPRSGNLRSRMPQGVAKK